LLRSELFGLRFPKRALPLPTTPPTSDESESGSEDDTVARSYRRDFPRRVVCITGSGSEHDRVARSFRRWPNLTEMRIVWYDAN